MMWTINSASRVGCARRPRTSSVQFSCPVDTSRRVLSHLGPHPIDHGHQFDCSPAINHSVAQGVTKEAEEFPPDSEHALPFKSCLPERCAIEPCKTVACQTERFIWRARRGEMKGETMTSTASQGSDVHTKGITITEHKREHGPFPPPNLLQTFFPAP